MANQSLSEWQSSIDAFFRDVVEPDHSQRLNDLELSAKRGLIVGLLFLAVSIILIISVYALVPYLTRFALSGAVEQIQLATKNLNDVSSSSQDAVNTLKTSVLEGKTKLSELAAQQKNVDNLSAFDRAARDVVTKLNQAGELSTARAEKYNLAITQLTEKIAAFELAINNGLSDARTHTKLGEYVKTFGKIRDDLEVQKKSYAEAFGKIEPDLKSIRDMIGSKQAGADSKDPSFVSFASAIGQTRDYFISTDQLLVQAQTQVNQFTSSVSELQGLRSRLMSIGGIGTGPVTYSVLAIAAMFATFGLSGLWRWSKQADEIRRAKDRLIHARFLALQASEIVSRTSGPDRTGDIAFLQIIESMLRGDKRAKSMSPLPLARAAQELVETIRGGNISGTSSQPGRSG